MQGDSPRSLVDDLRAEYVHLLLDRVKRDRYPSSTMMDMVEQTISADPDLYREYVEALFDKLTADRFPSPVLSQRIARLVGAFQTREGAQ